MNLPEESMQSQCVLALQTSPRISRTLLPALISKVQVFALVSPFGSDLDQQRIEGLYGVEELSDI